MNYGFHSRICGSRGAIDPRKCRNGRGLHIESPFKHVILTSRSQAAERRRRAFELYLASPPVATRNGLGCLAPGCAILTHKLCYRPEL